MVTRTHTLVAITAALAAGAMFVLAVRTVGLHELAARGHCGTHAQCQIENPLQSSD